MVIALATLPSFNISLFIFYLLQYKNTLALTLIKRQRRKTGLELVQRVQQ